MPKLDLVSVDHDAETPLWQQLADILRAKIKSGVHLPRSDDLISAAGGLDS
jgi:DNA-binding GntR family transcriptional regulator